jgi:uncharacterized membrane protein
MNKVTHWIVKIILIVAIFFVAAIWKASTRDSTGATSAWPGVIAGAGIIALLVIKPAKKRDSSITTVEPLDKNKR